MMPPPFRVLQWYPHHWNVVTYDQTGMRRRKGRKRIMLLMSDTGGGHRASAQAIIAGFQKLYGDKFELDMVDLWSDHSPWPHNTMPQSYSFLVKYPWLWRLSYTLTQPRPVHKTISLVTGWQVGHRVAMVCVGGGGGG